MYGTYTSLMTTLTLQFWIYGAPTDRHHPRNIAQSPCQPLKILDGQGPTRKT